MTTQQTARPRAIVVGSGIAGLTAALELGGCTVVTRSALGEGSSRWAQGGIAAAVGPGDTSADHAADTVAVAGGLSVASAVELITGRAPERVQWLHALGAELDVDTRGAFVLGREAGHRDRRIVHAGGDATGAAVMRALVAAVRARDDIEVREHVRVLDLVRAGDRVAGVTVVEGDGPRQVLCAPAVVLATGGIGRVYARTTNPVEATGDGLAMALRAGAEVRDPEFVQFHPTALDAPLDPRPLLTEALRGEGAHLVDADGRRYLPGVHPDAELAPRDVVARANWHQQLTGPIYLDARVVGEDFPHRFPTVFEAATAAGVDPRHQPIPTTPAQHYHVGGVRTDEHGRSTLAGLYVCGEAASVGLHGANRLASNSLIEGLVMGARVAAAIADQPAVAAGRGPWRVPTDALAEPVTADPDDVTALRELMWRHGGLVRDADGLRAALDQLAGLAPRLRRDPTARNLALVAEVVLSAALDRRESRGGHFRADHPEPHPGPGRHTLIRRGDVPHVPLAAASSGWKVAS